MKNGRDDQSIIIRKLDTEEMPSNLRFQTSFKEEQSEAKLHLTFNGFELK